jgi:myo-inositol 2-dehydrogenase/D-chiro-inositol 1-dehydrogenase
VNDVAFSLGVGIVAGRMTSESPIRFGLVGCGAWGSQHARAIAKTPGAQLAAIAEPSELNRANAKAAHPAAVLYDDYRTMLQEQELDAVDLVLPPHLHFEAAKAALQTGCHVLLEKPMCL